MPETYTDAFATIADARATLAYAAALLEQWQAERVPAPRCGIESEDEDPPVVVLSWMPTHGGDFPNFTLYIDGPQKTRWRYGYVKRSRPGGAGVPEEESGTSLLDALGKIARVMAAGASDG